MNRHTSDTGRCSEQADVAGRSCNSWCISLSGIVLERSIGRLFRRDPGGAGPTLIVVLIPLALLPDIPSLTSPGDLRRKRRKKILIENPPSEFQPKYHHNRFSISRSS